MELELATAKLYMDRPLGAESDRAHNVELALSYAVPAMQQLDRGVGADARIRLHELLGQIYATRFKQDSAETLERARHHFNEALKA